MAQQLVVALDGAEVVAPRVAVALRIQHLGVVLVDGAVYVAALILDVVVERVRDLATRDVAREVPHKAVVYGHRRHWRRERIVAAAQQAQLLFDQTARHVHEAVDGRGFRAVLTVLGAVGDRRIGGIGVGLVAQHHVQVGHAAGNQQQRVVGRRIVHRGQALDAELDAAPEYCLVDLDEAVVVEVEAVHWHVAAPTRAGLAHHADHGVDLAVGERTEGDLRAFDAAARRALCEGIDVAYNALDPAFGQLRYGPVAPLVGPGLGL